MRSGSCHVSTAQLHMLHLKLRTVSSLSVETRKQQNKPRQQPMAHTAQWCEPLALRVEMGAAREEEACRDGHWRPAAGRCTGNGADLRLEITRGLCCLILEARSRSTLEEASTASPGPGNSSSREQDQVEGVMWEEHPRAELLTSPYCRLSPVESSGNSRGRGQAGGRPGQRLAQGGNYRHMCPPCSLHVLPPCPSHVCCPCPPPAAHVPSPGISGTDAAVRS